MKKFVAALFVAAAGLLAWQIYRARHPQELEIFSRLPEFEAVALAPDGTRNFNRQTMAGKIWLANFIFTSCSGPCPILSARMAELEKALPKNIFLVTFTVDPENDTLDVLRDYGKKFQADFLHWTFVRMDKTQLYRLAYEGFRMGVAGNPKGEAGSQILHSTRLALVDGQGAVRGFYDSDKLNYQNLIEEEALRMLQEDKK